MSELSWEESLEIVIARTGHESYRQKCSESDPDHQIWRVRMIAKAEGQPPPPTPPRYPSLVRQAANLVGSMVTVVSAVVQGGPLMVPAEILQIRFAVCADCPHNGERVKGTVRCTLCGCHQHKLRLAAMICPDKPPRWLAWTPEEG